MSFDHIQSFKSKIEAITVSLKMTIADVSIPVDVRVELFMNHSALLPVLSPRELKALCREDRGFFVDVVSFLASRSQENRVMFVDHDLDLAEKPEAWERILAAGYSGYNRI